MNQNDAIQLSEAQYLQQIMANSKPYACEECGGKYFRQVNTIRLISKVFTGSPVDSLLPLPMFRCDDCGSPVQKLEIPESSKPTAPPSNLITE